MKVLIGTFFILLAFTGCTSIPRNAKTVVKWYDQPSSGEIYETQVGDMMLLRSKVTTGEFLHVQTEVGGFLYKIREGFYQLLGKNGKGKKFYSVRNSDNIRVYVGGFSDPPVALSVNKKNKVCVATDFAYEAACYEGADPKEVTLDIVSDQDFQKTLIYSGNSGTKIKISYREFSGGMARPAFTNNAEYDMEKSKIISYKEAKLEVIEYSNVSIKFRVLRQFN